MDETPHRKNMRLQGYDYSQNGAYFITICVDGKQKILGRVVGDAAHGVLDMQLSDVGEMVKRYIQNIPQHNGVILDNFVIMPNHIHLLIRIEGMSKATKNAGVPRAAENDGTPRAASPTTAAMTASIPRVINALKGLTSKKYGKSIWQRSYHDRIIRNEAEYLKIWRYIDENPQKWAEDRYYN